MFTPSLKPYRLDTDKLSARNIKPMKIKASKLPALALLSTGLLFSCHEEVGKKADNLPSVNQPSSSNQSSSDNPSTLVDQNCKRILVDASHDGGVWWFPQSDGEVFDPTKDHQGKKFADALRAKGFVVDELPRGTKISDQLIKDYRVIIRAGGFPSYDRIELVAYQNALQRGITLFLVSEFMNTGYQDNLADFLGVHFAGTYGGTVSKFSDHLLVKGMPKFEYRVGSVISNPGKNIEIIGWLENDLPVMGILDHPKSQIFLMGDVNSFESFNDQFQNNMTAWINQGCGSSNF